MSNIPMEVLIQRFLTEHYLAEIDTDDLVDICTYAYFCFDDIECFISWWSISNLGLGGLKPIVVAKQEHGLKRISHYLISLTRQSGNYSVLFDE